MRLAEIGDDTPVFRPQRLIRPRLWWWMSGDVTRNNTSELTAISWWHYRYLPSYSEVATWAPSSFSEMCTWRIKMPLGTRYSPETSKCRQEAYKSYGEFNFVTRIYKENRVQIQLLMTASRVWRRGKCGKEGLASNGDITASLGTRAPSTIKASYNTMIRWVEIMWWANFEKIDTSPMWL